MRGLKSGVSEATSLAVLAFGVLSGAGRVAVGGWAWAAAVSAAAIVGAEVFEHVRARGHPEPDPGARLWAWRDDNHGWSLSLLVATRGLAISGMLWFGDARAASATKLSLVLLVTVPFVVARAYVRDTDRVVRRRRRRQEQGIEEPRPSWSYDLLE